MSTESFHAAYYEQKKKKKKKKEDEKKKNFDIDPQEFTRQLVNSVDPDQTPRFAASDLGYTRFVSGAAPRKHMCGVCEQ